MLMSVLQSNHARMVQLVSTLLVDISAVVLTVSKGNIVIKVELRYFPVRLLASIPRLLSRCIPIFF